MNTQPIRDYIEAVEEKRRGRKLKSLELFCAAIGAKEPTVAIRENLTALLNPDILASEVALTLVMASSKRR